MTPPWRLLATVSILVALGPGASWANNLRNNDHDRARQALQAGEILPLRAILERIEREHPGQVVEIELGQDDDDHWIYDVELLRPGGVLVILEIDARNGNVLRTFKLGGAEQKRTTGSLKGNR